MKARTVVLLLSFFVLSSQNPALSHTGAHSALVLRSYPEPGAVEVPVSSSIGITAVGAFDRSVVTGNGIEVTGSQSGRHEGRIHLSLDRATAIFEPLVPFDLNETVSVTLAAKLVGEQSVADSFSFVTSQGAVKPFSEEELAYYRSEGAVGPNSSHHSDVPLNGPALNTTVDLSPSPAKIFLETFGGPPQMNYRYILDEHGVVLQSDLGQGSNFALQPNGQMTYFSAGNMYFGLDSSFNVIDTFTCTPEYAADGHELIVNRDGSYTILGLSHTTVNMQGIAGGDTAASITGNVIQTFDKSGNLVFQWRGIDHYNIFDAVHVDLMAKTIDFEHANSIDVDPDGNYLLSNRHLCEITKIDGKTGAIIWRFGGLNNQFTFVNDTISFTYQHFARWLPNGHLLFFDNGNYDSVQESRAVEYIMDQTQKTATLVWQYRHTPATFASAMGNAERLPNGNTFIGWGLDSSYAATEVQPDGKIVYELTLPGRIYSYRTLKYPQSTSGVAKSNDVTGVSLDVIRTSDGFDLSYSVGTSARASLAVFDISGRCVSRLFDGVCPAEGQQVHFPTSGLPSATYYCVLDSPQGRLVRPLAAIR